MQLTMTPEQFDDHVRAAYAAGTTTFKVAFARKLGLSDSEGRHQLAGANERGLLLASFNVVCPEDGCLHTIKRLRSMDEADVLEGTPMFCQLGHEFHVEKSDVNVVFGPSPQLRASVQTRA